MTKFEPMEVKLKSGEIKTDSSHCPAALPQAGI